MAYGRLFYPLDLFACEIANRTWLINSEFTSLLQEGNCFATVQLTEWIWILFYPSLPLQ